MIRLKDEGGRSAFIGIGFLDRSDSFDFNVAIQDHFKLVLFNKFIALELAIFMLFKFRYLKKDEEMAKNPPLEDEKKLDLSFKEGQTIKINIGVCFINKRIIRLLKNNKYF